MIISERVCTCLATQEELMRMVVAFRPRQAVVITYVTDFGDTSVLGNIESNQVFVVFAHLPYAIHGGWRRIKVNKGVSVQNLCQKGSCLRSTMTATHLPVV